MVPVIALAHQGVAMFPDDVLFKVPLTHPNQVVVKLAEAMRYLAASPEARQLRAESALAHVESTHLWKHRFDFMETIYERALQSPSPLGQM
jgi:hypothetical protein